LIGFVTFAYKLKKSFPIASNSYDDLVDMVAGDAGSPEKLMELSTLLPMLAEWCAIFNLPDTYGKLRRAIETVFKGTCLQLWYPDEKTDDCLYKTNASRNSGTTEAPICLPESLEQLKKRMHRLQSHALAPTEISCVRQGFASIALVASRHFRTAVLPFFWQGLLDAEGLGSPEPAKANREDP